MKYILSEIYFCGKLNDERKELLYFYFLNKLIKGTKKRKLEEKTKKYISKEDALYKLQKYCAYQERCHQEVRTKLIDLGCYGDDLEEVITSLITENFLNEERFAQSYARGKFRFKKWGRVRIRQELKFRKISTYCLKKAMEEINDEEYFEVIKTLLLKKNKVVRETNLFK
ncbi:RecX family transcriptional regulator, partial [bacterium]|nr:RecX family transcriptional regulator [bacterium]